ncbi:YicC domain stress-induced protein [Alkalihalophilus pseudofirmus OF4]|uniref:YicC domain stress-induced protein n=1 Tax=Alkalihalophilus pseudofirmus (strain ATCC BAA-2126 / JCM 17055 / OF4) TaxID=398511 RepID=D3FT95_ALKPO|nr:MULTISPECIES: YicC/YloC family endoribonuclease [Alkalihalophilus]ADC48163.1 YicC domain stress-induced protein [Alkalihalophilus pseudofirmus OF4]MED1602230.1 YicC family protein [Alkalihalophilus marmarensis]
MRSMTGYGRYSFKCDHFSIIVEAKAVNHRFFECSTRIPNEFLHLEEKIHSTVHNEIKRGKIDLFIHVEKAEFSRHKLEVDYELLKEYIKIANELKGSSNQVGGCLDVNTLLFDDRLVKKVEMEDKHAEEISLAILNSVTACVQELVDMKEREGDRLKKDLFIQLNHISNVLSKIETKAPDINLHLQKRMEERVASSLKELSEAVVDRIIAEACLYAEKADVNEELVRMRSHLSHFKEISENHDFPIGRKLDFLVQEMNREINTIGSKIHDAEVRQFVVSLKSYIEKIKEQVQNVE